MDKNDLLTTILLIGIVVVTLAYFWYLNEGRKIEVIYVSPNGSESAK